MTEPSPTITPSGRPAIGYGSLEIHVWFTKDDAGRLGAEVVIAGPPDMPLAFHQVACEHLMTGVALRSDRGFEATLEALARGAISNRGRLTNPGRESLLPGTT